MRACVLLAFITTGKVHKRCLHEIMEAFKEGSQITYARGVRDAAFRSLRNAMSHGFRDSPRLMTSPLFQELRGDPRYEWLVKQLREEVGRQK